jgi:hypothetical protein
LAMVVRSPGGCDKTIAVVAIVEIDASNELKGVSGTNVFRFR